MGFIFSSFTVYYHNQVLLFSDRQGMGFSLSFFTLTVCDSYTVSDLFQGARFLGFGVLSLLPPL